MGRVEHKNILDSVENGHEDAELLDWHDALVLPSLTLLLPLSFFLALLLYFYVSQYVIFFESCSGGSYQSPSGRGGLQRRRSLLLCHTQQPLQTTHRCPELSMHHT